MFFEGTVQEGISSAVDQQKLVFCFVAGTSMMVDDVVTPC